MTLALSERPQVLLEGCWLGKQVGELPLSSSHVRKKTKKCTRGLSRDNMRTLLSCAPGTWMQHLHIADHNPPFFVVVVFTKESAEYRHLSLFIPTLSTASFYSHHQAYAEAESQHELTATSMRQRAHFALAALI